MDQFFNDDHTTSKANIYQLKLPYRIVSSDHIIHSDLRGILSDYQIPHSELTQMIQIYGQEFKGLCQYINYIIDQKDQNKLVQPSASDNLLQKVIEYWFKGKNETKQKEEHIVIEIKQITEKQKLEKQKLEKQKSEKQKIEQTKTVPFKKLQFFVDNYWTIAQKLIQKKVIQKIQPSNLQPPLLVVGHSINGFKGFYDPPIHTILIDIDLPVYEAKLDELKTSKKVELTRTDSLLTNLFSPNSPTPTLIHELFHAILKSSHIGSSHPNVIFKVKDVEHNDTFDIGALELYKIILEHDLLPNFIEQLSQLS